MSSTCMLAFWIMLLAYCVLLVTILTLYLRLREERRTVTGNVPK